jgi:hypothetical protein
MTKKEIIHHIQDKTTFTDHVANYKEDLKNANELIREGVIEHDVYDSECPFPTTAPNLKFGIQFFKLVDGFDHTKY